MTNQTLFTKNPEYRLELLDGEAILYSAAHTKVMNLNRTSYLIWEMCNGRHTQQSITQVLCETYPESARQIPGDVEQALEVLLKNQALTLV
jgi:hypothetical protein